MQKKKEAPSPIGNLCRECGKKRGAKDDRNRVTILSVVKMGKFPEFLCATCGMRVMASRMAGPLLDNGVKPPTTAERKAGAKRFPGLKLV